MLPIDLFALIVLRALLLALPVAVGLLAVRRLLMSESLNAWVYALAVGYAAFSMAGLLPWALGLAGVPSFFVATALLAPVLWLATVVICGLGRQNRYDLPPADDDLSAFADTPPSPLRTAPLLLTDPIQPEPVPVFRHRPIPRFDPLPPPPSVMDVARAMRGRATSEARRVRKLLPPPAPGPADLPFLR